MQKFVAINWKVLQFLDVSALVVGSDRSASLAFKTGAFVGTVPLRAPDTGKQIGDFVVCPRFRSGIDRYSDYIEVLGLLESAVVPEYGQTIPLASGRHVLPPLYFQAAEFVRTLPRALAIAWHKFTTKRSFLSEPRGSIDWSRQSLRAHNPKLSLVLPCTHSNLTRFHHELKQLRFAFDVARSELNSARVPLTLRIQLSYLLSLLQNKLSEVQPSPCEHIAVHNSDPQPVRVAKWSANALLSGDNISSRGWRINFAQVFERFVQHIFRQVASEFGAHFTPNYRFVRTSSNNPTWSLHHLEPDAVLWSTSFTVVVDAKYKPHLLNIHGTTQSLVDEHRNDLHQVLSYSSFFTSGKRAVVLCYPTQNPMVKTVDYTNRLNGMTNQIVLLGLPMRVDSVEKAKQAILRYLSGIASRIQRSEA